MKSKMHILFVVLLVFASLFVIGCTNTPEEITKTPTPTVEEEIEETFPEEEIMPPIEEEELIEPEEQEISEIYLSDLYKYGSLNEYQYKVTSTAGGEESTTSFIFKISSDEVDGTDAWLQESIIDNEMANLKTKTWLDKVSHRCLKVVTEFDIDGEIVVNEGNCPNESSWEETQDMPTLSYTGNEEVSIPLGTYNAEKYELDLVSYWVESSVPLPLKVSYQDGSTVMELVSYS
jgi:hypothetical protein